MKNQGTKGKGDILGVETGLMSSETMVPLTEYLDRSFDPDCEYLDGVLLERNVGKRKHSRMQSLMVGTLLAQENAGGVLVLTEQRLQITPTRVRIPDLCVIRSTDPDDQVILKAPVLCIEVLSPDDRMSEMQDRVDDYLSIGTEIVWIFTNAHVHVKTHIPVV